MPSLPPVPSGLPATISRWLTEVRRLLIDDGVIEWTRVSKTGSSLADLATRAHSALTGIGTNTHAQIDTHISTATAHIAATTAHGSNGAVAGVADLPGTATTVAEGLVTQAGDVADLNQTISATYSQTEVQAISDKVDELLAAMRAADQLETP